MDSVTTLIFDADDTLWENNIYYINVTNSLSGIAQEAGLSEEDFDKRFYNLEHKMVAEHGYGSEIFIRIIRTFFQSNSEMTQLGGSAERVERIISEFNHHKQSGPVLFPGVQDTICMLTERYNLYVLTKGNYEEQLSKIKRSGLGKYFKEYFIEPEKDDSTFQRLIRDHEWDAKKICMIGNSPRSDINPALRSGLVAVYIPYAHTWKLDNEDVLSGHSQLHTVGQFSELRDLLLHD
jgi:putative hydrolase of the HAD superfamily